MPTTLNSTYPLHFPSLFFFNATAPPEIYTLSLHDALPISDGHAVLGQPGLGVVAQNAEFERAVVTGDPGVDAPRVRGSPRPVPTPAACSPRTRGASTPDRKSTRLNSSHTVISYAVFCLKKK